ENRFTGELGSELELMATLESTRDRIVPAKGTLQQIKPKMVWFSIKAKGGKDSGATGLRFGPLARFRAPAWGITVAGLPRTLAAEAEAWWTDQELLPSVELHRDQRHFTNPLEIAHRAIQTSVIEKEEQGTVVIESIRHELREVESRPGEKKKEECVVVRLSYPKGRPFFADIPNAIGAEHRFYTDAGKYTVVFFL